LKFDCSRRLADTSEVRRSGPTFDDGTLAAPEKCMHVTGMVIYIRRWDDRPVIGGINCCL